MLIQLQIFGVRRGDFVKGLIGIKQGQLPKSGKMNAEHLFLVMDGKVIFKSIHGYCTPSLPLQKPGREGIILQFSGYTTILGEVFFKTRQQAMQVNTIGAGSVAAGPNELRLYIHFTAPGQDYRLFCRPTYSAAPVSKF